MADITPVEILDEGKRVVRPDIMQFLMQAAQVSQLIKLRKLEESKGATGENNKTYSLTTKIRRIRPFPKWISFSLINDGVDDVVLTVARTDNPDISTDATIKKNQSYTYDATYPVINEIRIMAVNTTATVRIFAQEGTS